MTDNIYEKSDLIRFINEPLPMQYQRIMAKIMQAITWTEGDIAIAFSGGKDSALMLDMYCDIISTMYNSLKHKPIKVMWANTTNETKTMREYVPFFIKRCEEKYGVKIDFTEVTPAKGGEHCFGYERGRITLCVKICCESYTKSKKQYGRKRHHLPRH